MEYIALFEYEQGKKGYSVLFPDIPGCYSAGDDYKEAYRMAHEALASHIKWMKEDGDEIPQPRTVEQIKSEWEDWEEWEKNSNFLVVPIAYLPVTKPKKYSIYMDRSLMEKIDSITDNRSAFITKAAEMALKGY